MIKRVKVKHRAAPDRPDHSIEFAPNGMHLMLMGLKKPLVAGETFELNLVFELGGARKVKVAVR